MYFLGLSINILSMMGMLLAVGMLVDNAVVITESIFRHRQMTPDRPNEATLAGVRDVGIAVTAGTASSVAVFLPLLFGERTEATIFLAHVAIPIVVAMIASLLVAQTLIPMLTLRFPVPPPVTAGSLLGRVRERYARALAWTLEHKWMTAGGIVAILASVVLPAMQVKNDMFPPDSGRDLVMEYHIDGTFPLQRVESAVNLIEAYLEKNRERFEIQTLYSYFRPDQALTSLTLTPKGEAKKETKEIIAEITKELPEIIIGKPSFQFDQDSGGGFSMQLAGESTERLTELSQELARQFNSIEGLESARSEARNGEEEVQIIVDRERAAELGLSTEEIAGAVAIAMRGDKLKEFRGPEREVDMRLTFRASDRQNIEDLMRLPLYLPSGEHITLGSVAEFRVARGPRQITRVNRLTAVVIAANLKTDATLEEVKDRVTAFMNEITLPPGYTWKFGRGFEQNDETQQVMLISIGLGVAMIFLVMASLFESALYPLSIITSIVFAIVGVYWFFYLTGTTFTFMAMVGIMILVGVVVNIGIVLVAHINNLRATGLTRNAAIIQAGRDRLRPILMTTLTTLLAMLPLAIGDAQVGGGGVGGGGPAYFPMARAIIGGLAFSGVISLFVVPAFYEWFDDLNQWRRRVSGAARERNAPATIAAAAAQRSSTL
jgi:hydrophobic/amphiphilic exporter-1 (mainly G- bacteria), HAE1 family